MINAEYVDEELEATVTFVLEDTANLETLDCRDRHFDVESVLNAAAKEIEPAVDAEAGAVEFSGIDAIGSALETDDSEFKSDRCTGENIEEVLRFGRGILYLVLNAADGLPVRRPRTVMRITFRHAIAHFASRAKWMRL